MTTRIPLAGGREAMVDPEDAERVRAYRWSVTNGGYARATIPSCPTGLRTRSNRRRQAYLSMHRLVMNAPAGTDVDHINHDKLDNRKSNLRLVDDSQNQANRCFVRTASGRKGVTWHKRTGKWQAAIKVNGKSYHLGLYLDKDEAAAAYINAARKFFGEYAHPGTPA